jgi:hypothetical protein
MKFLLDYKFGIIILLTLILGVFIFKFRKQSFQNSSFNSICVFDIDNTITCGIDRASQAIKECKNRGAKIAINTARPTKWYSDLDLVSLGLHEDDFDSDFYYGGELKCSFGDRKCFEDTISETKVKHLYTLANKWNVNPRKVILFDDNFNNIEKARINGFSTIFANHHLCGLPENVVEQIRNILN